MSDDKQLTVAELLAKSGKSEGSSSRSRRRRRAEDGGVSVAELTGSLRAVDKKPAESRHSSRPIDEENPDQPAAPAGHERAESPEPEAEQRPDEAAEREPAQAEPAELRDEPQAGAAEREAGVASDRRHDSILSRTVMAGCLWRVAAKARPAPPRRNR